MSVFAGPKFTTDGLILCLDGANLKSAILKKSIINWDNWTTGSGGVTGYSQNGLTTENERINATDPFGSTSVVWETRASGDGEADGGWNTDWFNIDNTKLYRFSVWVRRTSSTSGGTFYLGMYANGDGSRRMDNGTVEGNAYWECTGTGNLTQNQWYLWVGHVYPASTTFTGRHPDTGYYTITGGRIGNVGGCNIGTGDLKWSNNSTQGLHRTYHYYCADSTTRLHFFQPRVDVCDGTEPTIAQLLSNAEATWFDSSGRGNHHAITGSPTWNNNRFTLNGSTQGFTRASSISGATSQCTVVIWYSTTDTQELWVRGNQDNTYYLSASLGNDYYHSNCGSPTNYVDLNTVINPETPVDYRNGSYHMWEAKNVNFSTWTYYEWWLYPSAWQMSGSVGTIMVYNRSITAAESAQNFAALRQRFGI